MTPAETRRRLGGMRLTSTGPISKLGRSGSEGDGMRCRIGPRAGLASLVSCLVLGVLLVVAGFSAWLHGSTAGCTEARLRLLHECTAASVAWLPASARPPAASTAPTSLTQGRTSRRRSRRSAHAVLPHFLRSAAHLPGGRAIQQAQSPPKSMRSGFNEGGRYLATEMLESKT